MRARSLGMAAVSVGFAVSLACGSRDESPVLAQDAGPSSEGGGDGSVPPRGSFPRDFLFGTAIAGFQVDMGCPTIAPERCEDRNSDWYQYITTPRIVNNPVLFMSKDPPSSGPGFYELFEEDLDRAAGKEDGQLGGGALRFSIEWSRLFPEPTFGVEGHAALRAIASQDGLDFYHRLFAAMKQRGLVPFVTVNHYSLPLWIHDANLCNQGLEGCIAEGKAGWADPDRSRIVGEIAKYAGFLAAEFGDEVDAWASLNEPFSAVVVAGYLISSPTRSNPPGLSGPWMHVDGAKTAAAAMIEAHARIYDAIKANDRVDVDGDGEAASVGIVYPYSDIRPATGSPEDAAIAEDTRYFLEDMFMDGACEGRLDERWDQGPGVAPVREDLADRCDFVGVNYYFRIDAKAGIVPGGFISPFLRFDPLAPMVSDPRGIYNALKRASRYGKPLYVTETGSPQESETRGAAWMVHTLAGVRRAIEDGIDVRGFFAWSLTDNYEWNHGMHMRFGLYAVAPEDKARSLRLAGDVYGAMSRARDVPAELEERYASELPDP